MIKPLDIVITPSGQLALVKEISAQMPLEKGGGTFEGRKKIFKEDKESLNFTASIIFIGPNIGKEHNAWWDFDKLEKVNSLPMLLSKAIAHPMGDGDEFVEMIYEDD